MPDQKINGAVVTRKGEGDTMNLWAIEINNPEYGPGDNLIGWGWFSEWKTPMSKNGYVGPALFPSREMAREKLPIVTKRAFQKAAVVKVKVVKI